MFSISSGHVRRESYSLADRIISYVCMIYIVSRIWLPSLPEPIFCSAVQPSRLAEIISPDLYILDYIFGSTSSRSTQMAFHAA